MTVELDARQTVPLAAADRKRLRRAAADLEISPGLLARALILVGLERLDDSAVKTRIEAESRDTQARSVAAGKTAMRVRYGRSSEKDKGSESEKEGPDHVNVGPAPEQEP